MREEDLDRAQDWFTRHGAAAVFFGCLLPVVRTFISLPAGFANMPAARSGLYTFAGCLAWCAALSSAGYAVGADWHAVVDVFRGPTWIIAGAVAVAVAAATALFLRRRAREGRKERSDA